MRAVAEVREVIAPRTVRRERKENIVVLLVLHQRSTVDGADGVEGCSPFPGTVWDICGHASDPEIG